MRYLLGMVCMRAENDEGQIYKTTSSIAIETPPKKGGPYYTKALIAITIPPIESQGSL